MLRRRKTGSNHLQNGYGFEQKFFKKFKVNLLLNLKEFFLEVIYEGPIYPQQLINQDANQKFEKRDDDKNQIYYSLSVLIHNSYFIKILKYM